MKLMVPGLCAASALAMATPASAQSTETQAPSQNAAPAEPATDADIVVTAKTIYEPTVTSFGDLGLTRVLDTPFSVNTISSGLIDVRQAVSIVDLQKIDPSIQVNFRGYANFVSLRGFQASGENSRLDGIPTPENAAIPLEIMDRVDVLRGPSGFLYGATAPGGVINYVLKRPTADPISQLGLRYSTDSNFLGTADFSRRIGGENGLGVRVAGVAERGEDYHPGNDPHRYVGSIALDWSPVETLHLQADAVLGRDAPRDGGGFQVFRLGAEAPIAPLNPRRRFAQHWERQTHITRIYGGKADWSVAPGWTLSLSGRRFDQPFTYFNAVYFLQPGRHYTGFVFNQKAQEKYTVGEAKLRGEFRTGPLAHVLTIAATTQYEQFFQSYRGFIPINPGSLDNPNLAIPEPANPLAPGKRYLESTELQHSLAFSDAITAGPWTLLAAAREVVITQKSYDADDGSTTYRERASKLTPTVGLVRKLGSKASLYASYAKGLEPGDTAPDTANNAQQTLSPNQSEQEEIGAKAELFAGLTATVAIFQIERDYTFTNLANEFVKTGKQSHKGAELTFGGPITRDFAAYGGLTYIDAKIKDVDDTSVAAASVEGATPIGVAKWQGSLFGEYRIAPNLFLNGNVFYSGPKFVSIPNQYKIEGYATFDIGARYVVPLAGHSLQLNVTLGNIFDKGYWSAVDNNRYLSLGVPRQLKVSAVVSF